MARTGCASERTINSTSFPSSAPWKTTQLYRDDAASGGGIRFPAGSEIHGKLRKITMVFHKMNFSLIKLLIERSGVLKHDFVCNIKVFPLVLNMIRVIFE